MPLQGGEKDLLVNDPWRKLGRRYSKVERDNTLPSITVTRPGPDTEGFYERLKETLNTSKASNRLSETLNRNRQEKRALQEAQFLADRWGSIDLSGVNPQFLSRPGVTGNGSTPSGVPLQQQYRVSSGYGSRVHPITKVRKLHDGIDFGAPEGTPIYATHSGRVIEAGNNGAWGNNVIIAGSEGVSTRYAHQSRLSVRPGQNVNRGQIIGYVGATGQSTGPHLHYSVYVNGRPVNPSAYL